MRERRSAKEVKPLLDFLADYCSRHFESEEQLMREKQFPGLAEHVVQHRSFREQVDDLLVRFQSKGPSATVTLDTQQFISSLVEHIGEADAKLVSFLAGGGLARET